MNEVITPSILEVKGPILVFGAGGFIGANLVRKILEVRSDVYAITQEHFVPVRLSDVPVNNIITCNQNKKFEVHELFNLIRPQTVFAYAAYGAYSRQTDTKLIYETNFLGVLNILEAAREFNIEAVVHAGSSSEYGTNCAGPKEFDHLKPNSHYAVSKASAQSLIWYYGKHLNVPAVNLRLYSVYGPLEDKDRLIPRLIERGLQKHYPNFVNPEISRDFVYIDDVIDASVKGALIGCKKFAGQSFNIASGEKTSIRNLAALSQELFSIEEGPSWGSMKDRMWDLQEWYGCPDAANELLGWQSNTTLRDGLLKTAEWFKKQSAIRIEHNKRQPLSNREKLSAIIACYKDEDAIPIMHKRLTDTFLKLKVAYEIIFVNDASPDNSASVLSQVAANDSHVVVVEHSRNFGSQSAFISGMELSTGDACILLDGDLQDPPELIEEFYKERQSGVDVVYGERIRREGGWFLGLCYKAFYRLFKRLAYIPIPVDAGDFSLIDRKVVDEILRMPERDHFLRGLRAWVGFKQKGIPYIRPKRMFGESTNNWKKNFWWARKAIFSFSYAPLEWLIYGGIALVSLSIVAIIMQVISKVLYPDIPHGITTLIVLALLFGGLNMLAISIIGEYLGKVLEEVKKRPKYIRKEITINGQKYSRRAEIEAIIEERSDYARSSHESL